MQLGVFIKLLNMCGFAIGTGGGIDASSITSGTIAAARLPSYVDDVLEYANLAAFPVTGETGKIYLDLATSFTYRWTGTVYTQVNANVADAITNGITDVAPSQNAVFDALALKDDILGVTAAVASSSGTVTIDLAATTSHYTLALTEDVSAWTFNNLPAAGKYRDIFVQITQHASAAKTVTSPASAGKTAGGAWTVSSTLSSVETLGVRVFSDGTKVLFPSGVFG